MLFRSYVLPADHVAALGQGNSIAGAHVVNKMFGMEIGLPPLASLQHVAVVNGRPTLYGDGQLAVAMVISATVAVSGSRIVDGDTGRNAKGDERFAVGTDELGHAVVLWLCCTLLAVMVPALVLGVSWADLVELLALIGGA